MKSTIKIKRKNTSVDAVICLGHIFTDPRAIRDMELRALKAADLFAQGFAPKIIFTGGCKTKKDLSEARFMAEIAKLRGVPESAIILEEKANTTIGNAFYSREIINNQNLKSVIILTSRYHLVRANYIFKKLMPTVGIKTLGAKTERSYLNLIAVILNEIKSLLLILAKGLDLRKV